MKITKRLEFDAGHRLLRHEGKCRNIHGHRYAVEVTCALREEQVLDDVGRVVDFGVIKGVFGKWLDDTVDHGFLFHIQDPLGPTFIAAGKHVAVPWEPTAENLASWFLREAASQLDNERLRVVGVTVFETPTCWATVEVAE